MVRQLRRPKSVSRFLLFTGVIIFVLWFGGTAAWNTRKTQLRYQCAENLIRIGSALAAYESKFHTPPPTLDLLYAEELIDSDTLHCPVAGVQNYEYDVHAKGLADRLWLTEPVNNHGDGANVLLGDGQCQFLTPDKLDAKQKPYR